MRSLAPSLLALAALGSKIGAETAPTPPTVTASGTPLVVSATRLEADPWFQPYALQRLDRSELNAVNARTLTDRLNYQPGVYVQRTAPNQASPYVRGLTGEQTLLLFNGIRFNHASMRPGPNQYLAMIPDEAVDRVDIILGSSSTVTGSDGLTGAIDIGLAPAGRAATTPISPFAGVRYGSADGASAHAGMDGRASGFAYSFELSHAEYHDLRGGKDAGDHLYGDAEGSQRIPNSSYRQYSLGGRVAYEAIENHRLELGIGFTRQSDAPRPDGYFENSGATGRISRYLDPEDFTYVHARHRWALQGPVEQVQSTLWYHRHDERQVREDISGGRYRERINDDRTDTIGLDVQLRSTVAELHALTYGATVYQDTTANDAQRRRSPAASTDPDLAVVDQTGSTNPGTTSIPDGSDYTGMAVFLQDSWQFTERWNLLGGLRWSHIDWSSTVTDDRPGFDSIDGVAGNNDPTASDDLSGDAAALTGSLRLGWQTTDEFFSFAGIGQAFRAPNLSNLVGVRDRASGSSGGTGPQTEGNPDLDAERSIVYEVGTRWQRGRDRAAINLHYTQLKDLIVLSYVDLDTDGDIDASDTARPVNAAEGWLAGFELSEDIGLPTFGLLREDLRLALVSTLTYVRGRADEPIPSASGGSQSEYISRANLMFGTAALKLSHDSGWWTSVRTRFQAGYDHVNPSDALDTRHTTFGAKGGPEGAMPGFVVCDLLVGLAHPDGTWSMVGSLENLFDHSYRPVGSGTDGSGLNAVLSLNARF